jgi:Flp pilus assembly pilin Flp
MSNCINNLRNDREGVTALEYGVVAAVTVVIIAASFTALTAPFQVLMNAIVAAL